MKKIIFLLTAVVLFSNCKEATKEQSAESSTQEEVIPQKTYPESITKVFEAHGGIDLWNAMSQLKYTIDRGGDANETHTVNLKDRRTLIDNKNYKLGFDGEKIWLDQDSTFFQPQRARFYHNLYFYFYAMPFILGDDGINYEEVEPLVFEGISYPGTKISFNSGVGDAPEDNYILYRNPETNEMAWLGYTVTYSTQQKSDKYSYIKYGEWQNVSGLKLPKTLNWYTVEEGKPVAERNAQPFTNVLVSKAPPLSDFFVKPEKGEYIE